MLPGCAHLGQLEVGSAGRRIQRLRDSVLFCERRQAILKERKQAGRRHNPAPVPLDRTSAPQALEQRTGEEATTRGELELTLVRELREAGRPQDVRLDG